MKNIEKDIQNKSIANYLNKFSNEKDCEKEHDEIEFGYTFKKYKQEKIENDATNIYDVYNDEITDIKSLR